jgi:phytoene desaturase
MVESRVPSYAGGRRAAVIGSGLGGLAAAIRLAASGFDTVVYETRDKPGGRAYVYEDQGFVFDAGPTIVTAPEAFEDLFAAAGRKLADYVELLPVKPFYRLVWDDGDSFDYVGDSSQMIEQIRARNPADAEGYLRFVDYAARVFAKGYTDLADVPFLRVWDMVKVAPALIRLRADRSVYDTVARFVQNDHVRQALSFHTLLVGGSPFETSAIYTLIHYLERHWGVFFPRGGTGALVRAMVRLFEELGGKLRLSTPATRIDLLPEGAIRRHRVHAGHSAEDFDLVVSNADVHHTYARLYAGLEAAERMGRRLRRANWSMSLFVLYFGTDRPYDIAHHTILFGPRYRGLIEDIFHGSRLPDDFSLYLHCPTVTDPTLGPAGAATFYVLSPVPHLGLAPVDWDAVGSGYAEKILAHLERLLPDLRRHVVTKRWITPLDFERTLVAYRGAAFSVAPELTQSAYFRPHNRDPHIPGLYLVGAGTHPGAGMPGVVGSAKATCRVIARDLGGIQL